MWLNEGFFVGLHHPALAGKKNVDGSPKVRLACISFNVLRNRKGPFEEPAEGWMMDSGAFTEVTTHGGYRSPPEDYARDAARWVSPKLKCIVAQDFMCEPFVLKKTGLTIADHQRLTVERYDALTLAWEKERIARGVEKGHWPPVMPVLQGYAPADYLRHLAMYGERLKPGMWVGIGSVCKRQGNVRVIEDLLIQIVAARPDLRFHGFGVKLTALSSLVVRVLLSTADSMAWSFSARKQGRNQNNIDEAVAFVEKVERLAA